MAIERDLSYRSGELARATGVSADTLRHYERLGLLPRPRRLPNGYRAYTPDDLDRVLLIQRAISVGFTLDELSRLFRARARGAPPCREVRALAAEKLREIDDRIRDLRAFRETLRRTLGGWDVRLAAVREGEPARLLETLAPSPSGRGSPIAALRFQHARHARKEKP